jgi:hypothetical protein
MENGSMTAIQRTPVSVRKTSGSWSSSDPLVVFLYILIRDEITPGWLEAVLNRCQPKNGATFFEFTNGWLAQYAMDVAGYLRKTE